MKNITTSNLIFCTFFLCIIVVVFSCKQEVKEKSKLPQPDSEVLKSEYFTNNQVLQLKSDIINNGDDYSFALLTIYYGYNPKKKHELLPFSMIMADKFKIKEAYYQVYLAFESIYDIKKEGFHFLNSLSKSKQEFVFDYLWQGVRVNDLPCIKLLQKCYAEGVGVKVDKKIADRLSIKIKNFK